MTSQRIRIVASFEELVTRPFSGDVNALCWRRRLPGDFQEVVDRLGAPDGITSLADDDIGSLALSPAGAVARDVLLADQALLRRHGLVPSLDCIAGYARADPHGPVATDVYSFHVDSAPVPADTYLCTYCGRSTEGLLNEDGERRVDIAQTRARLLENYGGIDDDAFAVHLAEHCYDLHYLPRTNARPYSFGCHNLWRIAIAYPGCPVAPCIHRAPPPEVGDPARLLLIS